MPVPVNEMIFVANALWGGGTALGGLILIQILLSQYRSILLPNAIESLSWFRVSLVGSALHRLYMNAGLLTRDKTTLAFQEWWLAFNWVAFLAVVLICIGSYRAFRPWFTGVFGSWFGPASAVWFAAWVVGSDALWHFVR